MVFVCRRLQSSPSIFNEQRRLNAFDQHRFMNQGDLKTCLENSELMTLPNIYLFALQIASALYCIKLCQTVMIMNLIIYRYAHAISTCVP